VEYGFTNRTPDKQLSNEALEWMKKEVIALEELRFTKEDINFLSSAVPYLPQRYLDYLKTFKLNPRDQVVIETNEKNELNIDIRGLWVETILYEIPILSLISEAYFRFVDTDWNYDGQVESAAEKTKTLLNHGCTFSEFGTRRRRSYKAQQLVLEGIVKGAKEVGKLNMLTGTSNVHFAREFALRPIGTVAHEWMMGTAAYTNDYRAANKQSMEMWLKTMGDEAAGFALTDTFGSEIFFKDFVPPFSDVYVGVRQDSGDPIEYTELAANHYKKLGYPPNTKKIIFSDSLNVEKCVQYKEAAEKNGLIPTFGVGTFFTNDFHTLDGQKSTPLNIVIKISAVNGNPAIKISDNIGKNTGDAETVRKVKEALGYTEKEWAEGDESKRWG
jgi:nicotinate phosphoribosyltransferase